jgi:hypothetical protein
MSNDTPSGAQDFAVRSATQQGFTKTMEKLSEVYVAAVREEQERLKQTHKIEITRLRETTAVEHARVQKEQSRLKTDITQLQGTIATKDARILELEESLREATASDAATDNSSPSSTASGSTPWEAQWDGDDEVYRCPKCNWELDAYPDYCGRCELGSGDSYVALVL